MNFDCQVNETDITLILCAWQSVECQLSTPHLVPALTIADLVELFGDDPDALAVWIEAFIQASDCLP